MRNSTIDKAAWFKLDTSKSKQFAAMQTAREAFETAAIAAIRQSKAGVPHSDGKLSPLADNETLAINYRFGVSAAVVPLTAATKAKALSYKV